MSYSGNKHNGLIINMKRIFDKFEVERPNVEDNFFMELINAVELDSIESVSKAKFSYKDNKPLSSLQKVKKDIKMDIMHEIRTICNSLKGKSGSTRYSFGLDIRKTALKLFLFQLKILIRDREYNKSDIIVLYDDTGTRFGTRGFAITIDEVVSKTTGKFKVLRFNEMTIKPALIKGLNKDVLRFHIDDKNYDVKVRKDQPYIEKVMDILELLFTYSREVLRDERNKQ